MFTDLEKKQILCKSFEIILPDYENCQFQLTYAVGMMFKYDTNLAFQMWEKLLRYYEKILMKDVSIPEQITPGSVKSFVLLPLIQPT